MMDKSRYACFGYDQRVEVFGPKGMLQVPNVSPDATQHYTIEGISKYYEDTLFEASTFH